MRIAFATMISLTLLAGVHAQTGDKSKAAPRYGIDLDAKKYPQSNPKEALGSVLKAVGEKEFAYMLAHLADPDFVDSRVKEYMKQISGALSEAQKTSLAFDRLT